MTVKRELKYFPNILVHGPVRSGKTEVVRSLIRNNDLKNTCDLRIFEGGMCNEYNEYNSSFDLESFVNGLYSEFLKRKQTKVFDKNIFAIFEGFEEVCKRYNVYEESRDKYSIFNKITTLLEQYYYYGFNFVFSSNTDKKEGFPIFALECLNSRIDLSDNNSCNYSNVTETVEFKRFSTK